MQIVAGTIDAHIIVNIIKPILFTAGFSAAAQYLLAVNTKPKRVEALVSGHPLAGQDVVDAVNTAIRTVRLTSILLKKSEIKQLRKSRVRANSVVSTGSSHSKA